MSEKFRPIGRRSFVMGAVATMAAGAMPAFGAEKATPAGLEVRCP